jgi:hypothetical protein
MSSPIDIIAIGIKNGWIRRPLVNSTTAAWIAARRDYQLTRYHHLAAWFRANGLTAHGTIPRRSGPGLPKKQLGPRLYLRLYMRLRRSLPSNVAAEVTRRNTDH